MAASATASESATPIKSISGISEIKSDMLWASTEESSTINTFNACAITTRFDIHDVDNPRGAPAFSALCRARNAPVYRCSTASTCRQIPTEKSLDGKRGILLRPIQIFGSRREIANYLTVIRQCDRARPGTERREGELQSANQDATFSAPGPLA